MSTHVNHAMSPIEWGLLALLSLLWGGSYFFNGVAVLELPTFCIVLARVGGAAATLLIVMRVLGAPLPRGLPLWRAFFAMGLLNNVVPFCFIVWGQSQIASGVASILNATTPMFTVVIAHFLTSDERLTVGRILGVAIGVVGVGALVGGDAVRALGDSVAGQVACLAGALSYALAALYGRRFRNMGVKPLAGALGQTSASTVMLLPLVAIADEPWTLPLPGTETWAALAGVAVLSTALGYIVYFRLLATAGAANAMLVTMVIPASAILLGALFLGEALGANHLAGLALIAIGLMVMDGRAVAFLRQANRI